MGMEIMVEKVRISVAMVTYNGNRYIREQMDSILKNLKEQDEVVVSDDGSTDGTLDILAEYQEKEPRIRIIEGPRQGIKKNVEHALRHCKGEYIFLSDQDDIWTDDKVDKVLQAFKQEQCTLVIHDAQVVGAKETEYQEIESFFAFRNAGAGVWKNIVKNSYIGCCMAFKRELLSKVLPIPGDIEMHDQWIGILNDKCYKASYFLREPLLLYRRHGDNNSGMKHYGVFRMIRNRVVFCWRFLQRILKHS